MRDWSDNVLDDVIAGALRSAVVTPQQRRRAWERLHLSAAAQPMLPAVATPARPPRRAHPVWLLLNPARRAVDWVLSLMLDDTCYDRALRHRYTRMNMSLFESPLRNMLGGVAT